jgi:hypothetical protein
MLRGLPIVPQAALSMTHFNSSFLQAILIDP